MEGRTPSSARRRHGPNQGTVALHPDEGVRGSTNSPKSHCKTNKDGAATHRPLFFAPLSSLSALFFH
jgi:hypothetical protein